MPDISYAFSVFKRIHQAFKEKRPLRFERQDGDYVIEFHNYSKKELDSDPFPPYTLKNKEREGIPAVVRFMRTMAGASEPLPYIIPIFTFSRPGEQGI